MKGEIQCSASRRLPGMWEDEEYEDPVIPIQVGHHEPAASGGIEASGNIIQNIRTAIFQLNMNLGRLDEREAKFLHSEIMALKDEVSKLPLSGRPSRRIGFQTDAKRTTQRKKNKPGPSVSPVSRKSNKRTR